MEVFCKKLIAIKHFFLLCYSEVKNGCSKFVYFLY